MFNLWIYYKKNITSFYHIKNEIEKYKNNISFFIVNKKKAFQFKKYIPMIPIGIIENISNIKNALNQTYDCELYIVNMLYLGNNYIHQIKIEYIQQLKKKYNRVGILLSINTIEDEKFIYELKNYVDYFILNVNKWKIIVLENILANFKDNLNKIIVFSNIKSEIDIADQIMENGVGGIIIKHINLFLDLLEENEKNKIIQKKLINNLSIAIVTKVKLLSLGYRACIDTCVIMSKNEGMLIGSQSNCLFLVLSESFENPFIKERPFRVNAGSIHSYIKVRDKLMYICDLQSGDNISIISNHGTEKFVNIGRVKIEIRPMILIEVTINRNKYTIILQNAETIRLASINNTSIKITNIKCGDNLLVLLNTGGRHCGTEVEETIIEK